jgi:arabinogalactan oligomer/maltooligosaccharide transport system permease protein
MAKVIGLGLVDALAIYGMLVLWNAQAWGYLIGLIALTVLVNWAYLSPRTIAAKYLVPGLIFLLVYQVFIIGYTFALSLTNFGDGNQGTKERAIETLIARNEIRVPDSPSYPLTVVEVGGELGFLVTDPTSGEQLVGTAEEPLSSAEGVEVTELQFADVLQRQQEVFDLRVPFSEDIEDGSLRTTDGRTAFQFQPTLEYDEATDTLTNTATGETFTADSEIGRFRNNETGRSITPGWQQFVGFENYVAVFTDPRVRQPFFSVFAWNIVFALGSVALPFAVGLLIAMVLQHKTMRGLRLYRAILILPYAIPGFLTTLVWQGLFNTRFGFINQELFGGASIPWLTDPTLARISILFVQLWLGFPYFFIVSTGALTSIPDDILEAARVDGANARQTFWQVKWPLLLIAVSPLMIASFAFNFNNFNTVRFLTNGGPLNTEAALTYGATDILITFVDKLAFAGVDRQYGFASAIAIVIFVLVAAISYVGFKRTNTFEEID